MKKKDSQLLVLISNKDIKSFNAFYHRYSNVIYSFVYRHLNDEVSSDDLVQDFWVKVWEDPSFLKCNESGSVKIYMLQHLKFRILDIYRKTLSQLVRECKIENADNEVVYNGILDEHNEIRIPEYERVFSYQIIEAFMVLANETVASYMHSIEAPFLYRIHG